MPAFSPYFENLKPYPFAEIGRACRQEEARSGQPVTRITIGIPDAEAPQSIKQNTAENILKKGSTHNYPIDGYPARGIDELVEAIRQHYRDRHATEVKPEQICVVGYTKPILQSLPRIFRGGRGVVPDPVYPAYEGGIGLDRRKETKLPTSESTGWLPDFQLDSSSAFCYFCDPNNPTDAVADLKYYERMVDKLRTRDAFMIADKAYKDLRLNPNVNPVSITQVPELMDNAFEVVSFSKHYNMVGIGLGWVVSSEENMKKWVKFWEITSQGVPWIFQKAGEFALTHPVVKKEMEEYMAALNRRADALVTGLNELGMKCSRPQSTPYVWFKVPEGYDDKEFVLNKTVPEAHVAFMPGSFFGESGKGYARATLYTSEEDIVSAMKRLKSVRDW